MTTIEIISPINGKGLGREYLSRPVLIDEFNYLEIAAIVRDDNGDPVKDVTVEVVATDTEQNKTLVGTGDVKKIYVDGSPVIVPIYSFHYEFHQTGDHTITFSTGGQSEAVTVTASEDTRPDNP